MHYMHYKDYILHDFYVYSPVLLTQYLGHCWHTSCTELNIWRIRCITFPGLLRKPPLPCHRGGGTIWLGGGVGVPAHIYTSPSFPHHFPTISQIKPAMAPHLLDDLDLLGAADDRRHSHIPHLREFLALPGSVTTWRSPEPSTTYENHGKTSETCGKTVEHLRKLWETCGKWVIHHGISGLFSG